MTTKVNVKVIGKQSRKAEDIVLLPVCQIHEKYNEFLIATTKLELEEYTTMLKKRGRENQLKALDGIICGVYKYTPEELKKMTEDEDNKDYKNWCNDVTLYFLIKTILFKTPYAVINGKHFNNAVKEIFQNDPSK